MSQPEIIVLPVFFGAIAYVVWVCVTASQRKQRTKLLTEFHGKLLDKLGSVKDFSEFLHTPAGARFMQDLSAEPLTASGPKERILRAGQVGTVLVCLGLGLLSLGLFSQLPGRADDGLTTIGVIALSLGIGFVISAFASYRIAGALGLLAERPDRSALPATAEL